MLRLSILLFLSFSRLLAGAQVSDSDTIFQSQKGYVSFVSDAPLEIISASSNSLKGIVDPAKGTFAFQLETKTLTGFNSPLQQEHFYENYIESEKYPRASFQGKIIEKIDFNKPGTLDIRAKGILDIHGKKMERIINCKLEVQKNSLTARSSFRVNLDDHNISIPKLVYQKIAEEILVDVEIRFEKITIPTQ